MQNIFLNLFFDNKYGGPEPETFSIGRSTFVIWEYITFSAVIIGMYNNDVTFVAGLPLAYWMFGLSCLAYTIGKQYIITSFFANSSNITNIKIDDDEVEGPH